jgi:CheY-like chemotaxis protein
MAAILCIDDDPDILNIQRALLGHKGCTVLTAADGITGIALARKHHPDVVVLDFTMPGIDSHHVAQVLMKDDPTLPVVMWSGDIDDLPDCLERFADALLRRSGGPGTFPSNVEPLVAPKLSA